MYDFSSRYNYLIFTFRLLFIIFFIVMFLGCIFFAVPHWRVEYGDTPKGWFVIVAGCLLTIFFPCYFGNTMWRQSENIIFQSGQLILKNSITSKETFLDKSQIKGFSISDYRLGMWNFKSVILYFVNGKKKEFPQFLYWNFKHIKSALIDNGILLLGEETERWNGFNRRYAFDE